MKSLAVLLSLAFCVAGLHAVPEASVLREGDVVFTGSARGQGGAIIAATGSELTHCGIVLVQDGRTVVLEAVQPVRVTPLDEFVKRSDRGLLAVKRLRAPVSPEAYRKARKWALKQVGKDYDPLFRWDNRDMYCSELVWKVYQKAGVRLCEPKRFRDYHLDRPVVKRIIDERYGGADKLPRDEKVVAPSDIAESAMLVDVTE